MLTVILFILFLAAGNGAVAIFYQMIQPGAALDIVFNWQKMLAGFYAKGGAWYKFLESALGGCMRCTSFWFMPIWFAGYYTISKLALQVWITDKVHGWFAICLVNFFWYALFHFLGAMSGYTVLSKFFKKKG